MQDGADWTNYLKEPPAEDSGDERTGICCSGGGIRAASFCLGGLEALEEANIFAKADHLAAVSGGGYIAVAHAALRGLTRRHADDADRARLEESFTALPPWSSGAPETVNLRNHTTYLAPDLNGRIWGAAVIVYGAVQHLLPFAALIVVAGTFYGLLLTVLPKLTFAGQQSPTFNPDLWRASFYACCGALGFAGLLIAARQGLGRRGTAWLSTRWPGIYAGLEVWTVRVILVSVFSGVLLCLVPILFAQINNGWRRLLAVATGNLSLTAFLHFLARRSRVASSTSVGRVVVIVAAYIAGPLKLTVAFLLMAYVAASHGVEWSGFGTAWWIVIAVAYLGAVSLFDDEVSGPMHELYRERLSTAFIRFRAVSGRQITTAEPSWDEAVNFAGIDSRGMPKLVICAAVNVAGDVVPPGRFAGSFTFEEDFSGGPLTGYLGTEELQTAAGEGMLTLPAMMAIAGAAFSPLMGRTTRPGWRLLFALFDVRLGVWLPNPRRLRGYMIAREIRRNPSTNDLAALRNMLRQARRPSRRFAGGRPPSRWLRPGWSYALREAFGLNSVRLPYVYITDGGHFENLGLVELLRRGCTEIVCFDASEDIKAPLTALGQAIALARDELGVDIAIDTRNMFPGSAGDARESRLVKSMVAKGRIRYPNGREGLLILVKNHLPVDAPRDVLAYAETDRKFPMDSTLNQFFDDQRFDAYRELGYHGGNHAAAILNSPNRQDYAGAPP